MVVRNSKTLCVVLTSPFALNAFLLKHLNALSDHYKITVCINTRDGHISQKLDNRIEVVHVSIERRVYLWRDLIALIVLTRLMASRKFDAVHSITPKGGLHGMLAAWLCRVPVRTHVFTGQVWATDVGFSRRILKTFDKLIVYFATDIWADSSSQARFLVDEGVCSSGRIVVPGDGSLSGVDIQRFSFNPNTREKVRRELGLNPDDLVFLFLGRFQKDKGVLILVEAFRCLATKYEHIHQLWVGPDEDNLTGELVRAFPGRSHVLGLTSVPEDYINASDVLIMPSFREGFGTVVIEAAAMRRPAIASDIYGLTDAVVDEVTGLLIPPKDVQSLYLAMERMLNQPERERMGNNAQIRAKQRFSDDRLTSYWLSYYKKMFDVDL